jgi:two-component system sensor histidine kinase BaeS
LLDNALRYTPAGGQVRLTLSVAEAEVRLVVADTGSGIPATALPHLFERFYTADPARAGGGSGLGLAIAREIVLAHGGRIEVTSQPGQGSHFTIRLPLAAVAAPGLLVGAR